MAKKKSEIPIENAILENIETPQKDNGVVDLKALGRQLAKEEGVSVEYYSDVEELPVTRFISSGDKVLDMITGGGVPLGRAIEIIGKESCGKTQLAMTMLNTMLNTEDGYALLVDREMVWEWPNRNIRLGLDPAKVKNVLKADITSIEALYTAVEDFIKKLAVDKKVTKPIYIIVDSVAAFVTDKEDGSKYGETGYLDHAKILTQSHRKLWTLFLENHITNFAIIYINQARDIIPRPGVFVPPSELETFGGRAIKFYSSIRILLTRQKQLAIKKGDKTYPVGVISKVKTIKNKLFYDNQNCTMRFMGATGIDSTMNMWDWLDDTGQIKKATPKEIASGKPPFYTLLLSGEKLFFDSGKSFRDCYQKDPATIEGIISTNYTTALAQVTSVVSGISDDVIQQDVAESKSESGEPASTGGASELIL